MSTQLIPCGANCTQCGAPFAEGLTLTAAAGGVQGLQAVNTMEFVVRALRGWAMNLVMQTAQAWRRSMKKACHNRASWLNNCTL